MPTVPRVTGPEVAPQGPPNAMLSTAGGDAAAFGGIQAREFGEAAAVAQRAVAVQQHEDRLRAAEEKRIAEEQRRAADHAQLIVATNAAKQKLDDAQEQFGNGILDGTIPKDQADAEFRKATAKVLEEASKALPQSRRAEALSNLQVDAANSARHVRHAVTLRDRQDVTSGITQTLEYLQRQYLKEPAKSTAQAMQTLDQLGPFSNLTPDHVAKLRQGWKEQTQEVAAFTLVQGAKDSPKALDGAEAMLKSPDALPDLDPQKRAAFLNHVDNFREAIQRKADAARLRALAEQEQRERHAATMTAQADKLALSGMLSPDYMTALITATRGTASQAAIEQLQARQRETGPLAAQPLSVQQTTLDAVNADIAKNGINQSRAERRSQSEAVLHATSSAVAADDVRAYLARAGQGRTVAPLNVAGGIASIVQQLPERRKLAEDVAQFTGQASSGLFPEEVVAIGKILTALPADQFGSSTAMLAQAMTPKQMQVLASRIDKHDRSLALALAAGSDMTTEGRTTAEVMRRGAQIMAEKRDKLDAKGDVTMQQLRADIYKTIGNAIQDEKTREQIADAAVLAHFGLIDNGSKGDAKYAVGLAMGGYIVKHNGHDLPVSGGITLDILRDRLRSYPQTAVTKQAPDGKVYSTAGPPKGVAEFLATLADAKLDPVGRGLYQVRSYSGVAVNQAGDPIIIEIK